MVSIILTTYILNNLSVPLLDGIKELLDSYSRFNYSVYVEQYNIYYNCQILIS